MFADLDELLENVRGEQLFVAFIEALGTDFASDLVLVEPKPWAGKML
ncbi:hypothetical protein QN382_08200 [Pseudomonas sp. 10B1]|nr:MULTISPECIES: hypothetical protein [unclassified Pseudomonas]MEA9992920.1 hypothetical protein [Pseudomonas sp. AA4]MEB0089095.1 hypothetical protein [Pseudomonas sp. RTI1]MEB0125702.1 hypothetical protein [Pseudomonas sp. CCC1.2]MEB0151505.1 hypothetical protein [Pseudomonas sp. CCC4.3]MEB0220508.1 hypothetical protein [Pseudomonas sp. AB12(2023)]